MDEAGISKLPEPILHHILSLLPQDQEAVRTCVLSKSWRHLVSTRPKFSLHESYYSSDKQKFMSVLDKSLQVYYDQKLSIEDFSLSMVDLVFQWYLEKWIPKLMHDMGVKKFHLSFSSPKSAYFDVPSAVFESESLQELYLKRCNLSQKINYSNGDNHHHLKILNLEFVNMKKEETFAKIMSRCSLIEHLSIRDCKGLRTINMHNHRNLKSFNLLNDAGSIEIYLPSCVGHISIDRCRNWFHHRNHFPGLTFLKLSYVPLSNEWFNSFSRNFPCLEELKLWSCYGFDEFQMSSRSIKNLDIRMDGSTTIKATIDAPSIKEFHYQANISQSQSFSFTKTPSEWNSQIVVSLNLNASLWLPKLSELVAAFSRSQISLELSHPDIWNQRIKQYLSDVSACCSGSHKMPVAMKRLILFLAGRYYDSFLSDLTTGLFRIFRPRELKLIWYNNEQNKEAVEFLCRTLQKMGRWEDEGKMNFWQQDLEEVSLDVYDNEWNQHHVEGTISWSEYVAAFFAPLEYHTYKLRFRLEWRVSTN